MSLRRLIRHLLLPDWWARRAFPQAALERLEQAIKAAEHGHRGELRVLVEAGLPVHRLFSGQSTRARAIELFSRLGVWDTEHNSGVLVYVQLLDRRVEIVADRGINDRVGEAFWSGVCRRMEVAFLNGDFERGSVQALKEIAAVLVEYFPATGDNPDELPNTPVLL